MTMNSKAGCMVIETDSFWFFLGPFKYILAGIGIICGLITLFAGRLLLRFVAFASVICGMACVANAATFVLLNGIDASTFAYWIALVVAAVCGLLLAWVFTKYPTGGALMVAGWTGFELGVAISNLLYFQLQSLALFWMIIGMTALITTLIAATNVNYHMIWVTAIFGAYLFIISVSLFVGRWPIELNLPKLDSVGAVIGTEPNYFLYMGIWLCMSCIGVAFQCYILWHYKKTGKRLSPKIQDAVDNFQYGKTAE